MMCFPVMGNRFFPERISRVGKFADSARGSWCCSGRAALSPRSFASHRGIPAIPLDRPIIPLRYSFASIRHKSLQIRIDDEFEVEMYRTTRVSRARAILQSNDAYRTISVARYEPENKHTAKRGQCRLGKSSRFATDVWQNVAFRPTECCLMGRNIGEQTSRFFEWRRTT
ncbi:hypothetical protein K0M31_019736 [Melipona bicolor]|uniref:Uncharacterized protein n=1 Tax=Melipona bicolor TaxID=60889 RepID=A0AA40G302_9HYME|nr:hypothetical protein K0M31_019736 [Melipona bicolor]